MKLSIPVNWTNPSQYLSMMFGLPFYLFFIEIPTFNPDLPSGPVHPYQLDESISNLKGIWCTFSFLFYFESIFLLANKEEPDQS